MGAEEKHRLQVLFLQKENNHLKETSEASELNINEIKKSLESVIEIKKANKVLTDGLETSKRKFEENRNHASKLNDIILGLETTVQAQTDTIEELTKKSYELQQYKSVVSCLKDKVSKLDNELVELKKENKDLYSSQIETQEIALGSTTELKKANNDLSDDLKTFKSSVAQKERLIFEMSANITNLESKQMEIGQLNENLYLSHSVKQDQNTKLEKRIKIDNETIFELTKQVKATNTKLEEKDKEVYELNNNIAKLKTAVQIQNENRKVQENEMIVCDLKYKINKVEKKSVELKKQNENLHVKYTEKQ